MIRSAVLAVTLATAALPAAAEEGDVKDGFNLLEEGAQLLLRGLMNEMEPAMRDFAEGLEGIEPQIRDFARQMGPMLGELQEMIGDLSAYHPPERLPNGDIILRRRQPDAEQDPVPDENGQIDL